MRGSPRRSPRHWRRGPLNNDPGSPRQFTAKVIGQPQRERNDHDRGHVAARRRKDGATGDIEIVCSVDATIGIHDTGCRVVAHARGAHVMPGAENFLVRIVLRHERAQSSSRQFPDDELLYSA